jgi:hypothetical protein
MTSGAVGERLADGRVVDEPTVVNGPLLSAIRGLLHGAHMNRCARTTSKACQLRSTHAAFLGITMLFRIVSPQSFPEHQLFRIERFPHGCHEEEP